MEVFLVIIELICKLPDPNKVGQKLLKLFRRRKR